MRNAGPFLEAIIFKQLELTWLLNPGKEALPKVRIQLTRTSDVLPTPSTREM
jgi:hypothetical protein